MTVETPLVVSPSVSRSKTAVSANLEAEYANVTSVSCVHKRPVELRLVRCINVKITASYVGHYSLKHAGLVCLLDNVKSTSYPK